MTEHFEGMGKMPLLEALAGLRETFWINPNKIPAAQAVAACPLGIKDILDASERLERFAPYLAEAFPETAPLGGIIESPITEVPKMLEFLKEDEKTDIPGRLFLKCDNRLPISGSIKARGGIYEVLKLAEDIAVDSKMLTYEDDYAILAGENFRELFSKYTVVVGSTGNLGLSIGIMGAKLGFHVTVHMSADARQWKKDLLREKGVQVVEHEDDYSKAVSVGRRQAAETPNCHFIDDENSRTLFLGYSVAALRLKNQLEENHIRVDGGHPLFVYLPCGVGGGPGGVTFGLKQVFGDAAHCFFAEPTHSPCMLLGLYTGLYDQISVQDYGIDNITAADGLAVGRASKFVGRLIEPFLSGCYTVKDERLFRYLAKLIDLEKIRLEPSALAGMVGPNYVSASPLGIEYLKNSGIYSVMDSAVHLVWATGGNMVPDDEMSKYYLTGRNS